VPFCVYAYTFGQLLVLSLYKQYKEEGESFIPRYFDILSAGGSASPEEILTNAGIDMRAEVLRFGYNVLNKSEVDEGFSISTTILFGQLLSRELSCRIQE